jgi:hypothetical protein
MLPRRFSSGRAVWLAGFLSLHLAACSQGDFGEVRPSLVRDDIHDWMGRAAGPTGNAPVSEFPYTDDERLLRDLAYPLIEPPYDRKKWNSVLGEYGLRGYARDNRLQRQAYADHLLGDSYRSPTARYQKLLEDIGNDIVRLPPFFEVSMRIIDIDAKRKRALDFTQSDKIERSGAILRIRENANVVAWVEISLNDRLAAYRYALERLVVMTPSPMAVEVERNLRVLRTAVDERGRGPAPIARLRYFPISK